MPSHPDRSQYLDPQSCQTLREGLAEYYAANPHVTQPDSQPSDFGQILAAHDALHVIYGCDTGMYDELRLLPLSWWTSSCTFGEYIKMRRNPAVDVMYDDMIRDKGQLWLLGAVAQVLPALLPHLFWLWRQTRQVQKRLPFLAFEPLLDRSLIDIREEFDLLRLMT